MRNEPIGVGMTPSHPGEFVREEVLAPLGLSVAQAAKVLRVRRATLSDLVNEKASLSPEMALRLEKAFGLSMDQLLRMQAWHDAAKMRKRASRVSVRRYVPPVAARKTGVSRYVRSPTARRRK
jgi:addiction module HigA family antidote